MKKRLTAVIAAIMLVLCLCMSCGNAADIQSGNESITEIPIAQAEENTGAPEGGTTEEPQKKITDTSGYNEPLKFVYDMKIGWNLGNTFDAYTDTNVYDDDLKYETIWAGSETTEALFDAIAGQGFGSVRIPVSWHNHVTGEDFKINEAWLDRVQQVVDYGYSRGLYIIINTHHDVYPEYYFPSSEYLESSKHYIECIWKQVAERFRDYDEHLVFESLNEPRLRGSTYEWWIPAGNKEVADSISCINELNQVFVDTVRASGGGNASRYLMVPGYDASPDGALNAGFVLPNDTVTDRLIVSVHAYTPYNFALQGPAESGSVSSFDPDSTGSTAEIDRFMQGLYDKFISNGVPVIIGEFGARDKSNNTEDRAKFTAYYVAKARSLGITCFWWDNNSFGSTNSSSEDFGLIARYVNKFRYPDIMDAMMDNCE